MLYPVAEVVGKRHVAEQGVGDLLPAGHDMVRGEIEHFDGRGRVAEHLQKFFLIPGLERIERRVANVVFLVVGEIDKDLNFLIYGEGKASVSGFAPDDLGGLAFTQGID